MDGPTIDPTVSLLATFVAALVTGIAELPAERAGDLLCNEGIPKMSKAVIVVHLALNFGMGSVDASNGWHGSESDA